MYVEKDNQGRIIIQDISEIEAETLVDALCLYLGNIPVNHRNDVDRALITLKKELEKLY